MNLTPRQVNREELLDLGRGSEAEMRRSLRDLQRINAWLGGARVVCEATLRILQKHNLQRATLLDIGTGAADIPKRLVMLTQHHHIDLRIIALDMTWRHLQIAREETASVNQIQLLQSDAFRLPLRDEGVDIITASLFLHHFRPSQIGLLLREFQRVSRLGWVANDLVRHYVPIAFFRLTWPLFARSYITRHDGIASLRRAYTLDEMRRIVAEAGLPRVTVREHFPYRMSIVSEK